MLGEAEDGLADGIGGVIVATDIADQLVAVADFEVLLADDFLCVREAVGVSFLVGHDGGSIVLCVFVHGR